MWMGTGPGGSGTSSRPHAPSGGLGLHRSLTPVSGGGWIPAGQHCCQGGEGQLRHSHGTGSSRGRRVRTQLGAGAGEPWGLPCLAVLEPPEKHLETTADGAWGLARCSVMIGRSVTGGHPVALSECSHTVYQPDKSSLQKKMWTDQSCQTPLASAKHCGTAESDRQRGSGTVAPERKHTE